MLFLKWGVKNYYMKVALSMFYGMIAVITVYDRMYQSVDSLIMVAYCNS